MKRIISILLLAIAILPQAGAQIFTQVIDEQELQFKVKLIDEFFSRFNYETDYKGEPVTLHADSVALDSMMKRDNIKTLLNLDTFADSNYKLDSVAAGFVDYVIANNKQIHYADTTWYAVAKASVMMDKKSYPIDITLQTEHVDGTIYKWVIRDIDTPALAAISDSIANSISIFPGAHGSSFMTLPETINMNAEKVQSLFHKDYKPDALSVFAYLVSTGKMKMQPVTKVKYRFDIGDYIFWVERFEKADSYNKGWLISNIIRNLQ